MTSISNKITTQDVFVAGARSTGKLHIGNYFGAIKNFVDLSNLNQNPMYFFIADLHSLTTHTQVDELKSNNILTLASYLGCGLNPDKATIYFQSDIPAISELYLYLNMFANVSELERTATFKEKIQQHASNINAGLLTYPVLMAADILIHKGTKVPVGKDQAQHIEMTRDFGNRFNHVYNTNYFPESKAFTYSDTLVNIPSLSGKGKMSKSDEDESNAIFLTDTDEIITKKIKRAVTDSGPKAPNSPLSPEVTNLITLMKLFSTQEVVDFYIKAYEDATIRYGDMKKQLAEDMVQYIRPIRENINYYLENRSILKEIAEKGAEKANISANNTIKEVREIMGLSSKNIFN